MALPPGFVPAASRSSATRPATGNAARKPVAARPQEQPVVPRVREQQQHVIDAAVPLLQCKAPLQFLGIPRTGLRLHPDPNSPRDDEGVPGPPVTNHG